MALPESPMLIAFVQNIPCPQQLCSWRCIDFNYQQLAFPSIEKIQFADWVYACVITEINVKNEHLSFWRLAIARGLSKRPEAVQLFRVKSIHGCDRLNYL